MHELFAQPRMPDCLVPGAPWKLEGSIGSQRIMLGSDVFSSNIMPGQLHVVGAAPDGEATVDDTYHPLILTWEGSLMRGAVKSLTGERFLMPGGDPEKPGGFCITAGDFGPSMHAPGVLFHFRIRSVRSYADGECTGAEQPASLAGCMFRTSELLP